MTRTDLPPFPLPNGHFWGPDKNDLAHHTGRDSWPDNMHLCRWQREVGVEATGVFDGLTQRAAIAVQQTAGLPVTGLVDADTWACAFAGLVEAPETAIETPGPSPEGSANPEVPGWFTGALGPEVIALLQERFEVKATGQVNRWLKEKVRGFQAAHGLETTGEVDQRTAVLIGDLP